MTPRQKYMLAAAAVVAIVVIGVVVWYVTKKDDKSKATTAKKVANVGAGYPMQQRAMSPLLQNLALKHAEANNYYAQACGECQSDAPPTCGNVLLAMDTEVKMLYKNAENS